MSRVPWSEPDTVGRRPCGQKKATDYEPTPCRLLSTQKHSLRLQLRAEPDTRSTVVRYWIESVRWSDRPRPMPRLAEDDDGMRVTQRLGLWNALPSTLIVGILGSPLVLWMHWLGATNEPRFWIVLICDLCLIVAGFAEWLAAMLLRREVIWSDGRCQLRHTMLGSTIGPSETCDLAVCLLDDFAITSQSPEGDLHRFALLVLPIDQPNTIDAPQVCAVIPSPSVPGSHLNVEQFSIRFGIPWLTDFVLNKGNELVQRMG